ncbi:MAG TPA: UDP-N-acetylmuramoyl-L-alanyl-D-glutamate--2,6-diaminopimelate ligase [Spirochaetia bacterium]
MPEVTLSSLLSPIPVLETVGDMRRTVRGVAYDSRDVEPGFLFVAMDGIHTDGHRFVPDAVARGAVAVIHSRPVTPRPEGVTLVRVEDPRACLSPVAAAFWSHPSRSIKVIGVTGTDGKSSTVWFITQLLGFLGHRTGFLSTVSFLIGDEVVKNPFRQSTPESTEIQGMMRGMVEGGKEFVVVEATSHGLSKKTNRLGDVLFDAAVFTNVTHEHLEFHGTFEQYRSDKANLFRALSPESRKDVRCPRVGVVNADDPSAPYFRDACRVPVASYGVRGPADLGARDIRSGIGGSDFLMTDAGGAAAARINIPGPFWVPNALAACLTVARVLEVPPLSVAPLVERLKGVKGRMEYVDLGQPFAVIVDYAHTPGAFATLFPWVRAHTQGRLGVVFGSAGERDHEKRPMQGKVAGDLCDFVVITDEDPRGDDRMGILEQIAAGCTAKTRGRDLFLIPDRAEAIRHALSRARPGDTVMLLGKGHEASIIGPNGPSQWDERAVAEEALRGLGYGT